MAFPALAQLPFFFGITIGLRDIAQMPNTPFDSEAFLTLTTLAHPDPTMVLPIVLGLVTMANVETSNLLMTATQRARLEQMEKKREAAKQAGKTMFVPGAIIKDVLRGLSVVRILVASVVPGVSRCTLSSGILLNAASERHTLLAQFSHVWSAPDMGHGLARLPEAEGL